MTGKKLLLLGLFGLWVGLGGCKRGGEGASEALLKVLPDLGDGAGFDGQEVIPLTAENIAPIVQAVGPAQAVPQAIVVTFSRPLFEDGIPPLDSEETVLEIVPETKGTLEFRDRATLAFVPREGFLPEQHYQVTLKSVQSRSGVLSGEGWTLELDTPVFKGQGLVFATAPDPDKELHLGLVFSAAVRARSVEDLVSLLIDDRPVSFSLGRWERGVMLRIRRYTLKPGSTISLRLRAGAKSRLDSSIRAPADRFSLTLPENPAVALMSVTPKEGPTGHYLEVRCDDQAVEGYRSWYWDQDTDDWYRISNRCVPDPDTLRSRLQIVPKVDWHLGPGEHGFRILGDFSRGAYTLTLDSGIRTKDGGEVATDLAQTVVIPARAPQVAFLSKGRYLPRDAWNRLPIRHLNVDGLTLEVRHVPRANLVFWMTGDDERAGRRSSDQILKVELPVANDPDAMQTSWLDLSKHIEDADPGLYELTVSAPGTHDAVRFLRTDIQLVAKRSAPGPTLPYGDSIEAWAFDVQDNHPLAGVELSVVRASGKSLGRCQTGRDGACSLSLDLDLVDLSPPIALLAQKGSDLTYLKFSDLLLEPEASVHGEPYASERPYRLASYTDRGVYRPGETAHLVGILRDAQNQAPPEPLPVVLEVEDPRGRLLRRVNLTSSPEGVINEDISFEDFATTGRYPLRFRVAGDLIASASVQVEEFVPERMKATATLTQEQVLAGQPLGVEVEARYLFGGSAQGSPVELTCQVLPEVWTPPGRKGMAFGPLSLEDELPRPMTLGTVLGELGEDGSAHLLCPKSDSVGIEGRIEARVAVMESGSGRATQAQASGRVHPEPFLIGLESGVAKAQAGSTFLVKGLVVNWDGEPIATLDSIDVEYARLDAEWGMFWDDDEGTERWDRRLRRVVEGQETVAVKGGSFQLAVTPESNSEGYLVTVRAGKARTDLRLEGSGSYYWWSSGDDLEHTPRPERPRSLDIEVAGSLRAGKKATATFDAPWRGRALMTIETDRVLSSEWVDIEAGPVEWTFKVEDFAPNVYVTAFAIKDPHLESQDAFVPERAYGVQSVAMKPERWSQDIVLSVPEEVRPRSPLEIKLDLGKSKEPRVITVAAVDEGILQLTHFETPDPREQIFAQRALGVDSYETVGWTLLRPPGGPSSSTGGGDDAGNDGGRVQPVKPVALWSGVLAVPASGVLTVFLDVPNYRGKLRVMAVATGRERMGSAEAQVLVRDPIVVQSTLPRFMAAGDQAQIPVFVTNLSGTHRSIRVTLEAEDLPMPGVAVPADGGPFEALSELDKTVELDDQASTTVVFEVKNRRVVGAAHVLVRASSGELVSEDSLELPFHPNAPMERGLRVVELGSGDTALGEYFSEWMPTTDLSSLWVTANPYGEAFSHLPQLIRYPYGCIEQTTSSTRPLLYVDSLLRASHPELLEEKPLDDMVDHGIDRLLSMQTPSGGFAYWPGSTRAVHWGTANATHLLMDAKAEGYEVTQSRVDDALEWMEAELERSPSGGDPSWYHRSFQAAAPYMEYVLARAGKGNKARIVQRLDGITGGQGEDKEARYLLMAALYLSGDRRHESALRRPDVAPLKSERSNGWSYYSDLRRRGFVLSVYEDLFGSTDEAGEALAQIVFDGLRRKRSSWYTTQELVWGITALGKRVQDLDSSFEPPTLTRAGKEVKPSAAVGQERTWSVYNGSGSGELVMHLLSGKESKGKVRLLINTEGVRSGAQWTYGGSGLALRQEILTQDGGSLEGPGGLEMELGQVGVVHIALKNTGSAPVSNVALVARLPAGWEIENPRLGRAGVSTRVNPDNLWSVDFMNVRDDRNEWFGALPSKGIVELVYTVRAVTAGRFSLPPLEAEAMYDSEIWARIPGAAVQIHGPWTSTVAASP